MSFEVAELPFQAQANYGTWSIDFDNNLVFRQKAILFLHRPGLKDDLARIYLVNAYGYKFTITQSLQIGTLVLGHFRTVLQDVLIKIL